MTLNGWLQIVIILATVLLAAVPLGTFMAKVYAGKPTFLSPVFGPVERGFYALAGIDPAREQGGAPIRWRCSCSMRPASRCSTRSCGSKASCRSTRRASAPSRPISPSTPRSASSPTRTGSPMAARPRMSHFSRWLGSRCRTSSPPPPASRSRWRWSAASRAPRRERVGNFWVDLTRATLYVLLPLSIVTAVLLVALGMPQTLLASVDATTLEGAKQTIALGPVASQEAIKQLGTNGGGFFNANAAHPFENPTALANFIQIWRCW